MVVRLGRVVEEGRGEIYICLGDIFGRANPFNFVAELLNGIDEAADVASDVVEEVDGRHDGCAVVEGGAGIQRLWVG